MGCDIFLQGMKYQGSSSVSAPEENKVLKTELGVELGPASLCGHNSAAFGSACKTKGFKRTLSL